mgnify:CR=1 FL=1
MNKSPHFTQLGQWLTQNPNFEPVKPGTPQAEQILSKNRTSTQTQAQFQPQPQVPTSTNAPVTSHPAKQPQTSSGEDLFSNPIKINTGATPTVVVKKTPTAQGQHPSSSALQKSNISVKNTSNTAVVKPTLSSVKSPSVTSSTPSKTAPSKPAAKRQFSEERSPSSSTKVKIEQERTSVRNILRDTLKQRMVEFEHPPNIPKMNEEEILSLIHI